MKAWKANSRFAVEHAGRCKAHFLGTTRYFDCPRAYGPDGFISFPRYLSLSPPPEKKQLHKESLRGLGRSIGFRLHYFQYTVLAGECSRFGGRRDQPKQAVEGIRDWLRGIWGYLGVREGRGCWASVTLSRKENREGLSCLCSSMESATAGMGLQSRMRVHLHDDAR